MRGGGDERVVLVGEVKVASGRGDDVPGDGTV